MDIDTGPHLATTGREVRAEVQDGQELRVVVIRRRYDTGVDDLWDAVTTAERIPRWFLPISGDLRLGGHYQLEGNAGGTITACEPPEHVGLTWEYGGGTSWVDLRLSPVDGGAQLELEHRMPADEIEHWAQFGPGAVGLGWDQGLLGLGLHLASGTAVDHEAAMAWAVSTGGKAFVRICSDAWCDASIASGTPEADARAAAERTRAAYSGEPVPED